MHELQPREQEFLNKLYIEHYNRLFNYAVQFLEASSAEEAVQNVFMDACLKIDDLMASENPAGWLRIALKYSISKIKRSKGQFARLMIYLPPNADLQSDLRQSMADFPDERPPEENVDILYNNLADYREFQLLKKFAVEEKSLKEIAEEEKITLNACKQKLYRARLKLRRLLRKPGE